MVSQNPILERALKTYRGDKALMGFAKATAKVEASVYMKWTRVEDTIEFAREMGYQTLGIASCGPEERSGHTGVRLQRERFSVVSATCKTGGIPKETMGIKDSEKVTPGSFEAMCNPWLRPCYSTQRGRSSAS